MSVQNSSLPFINYEQKVCKYLIDNKITISTAESCTGGMIAARLVDVNGISEIFNEGYITYANEAKVKILNVKKKTLNKYGAVSKETAKEMCYGVCKASKAKLGISVTGIAGPDGGTLEKPVGTVYIGICYKNKIVVKHFIFTGGRQEVRRSSVENAIKLAYRVVKMVDKV